MPGMQRRRGAVCFSGVCRAALVLATATRCAAADSTCPTAAGRVCTGPATQEEFLEQATARGVYDKRLAPAQACGSGTPTVVEVQFHVTFLDHVDQAKSLVTLGGHFRQWWRDPRLAYNATADGGCFDSVVLPEALGASGPLWTPGLHVVNAVDRGPTAGAGAVTISPDGSVWASSKRLLEVRASMSFDRMPFDSHWIELDVASFSLPNSVLRVVARGGTPGLAEGGAGVTSGKVSSSMWTIQGGDAGQEDGMRVPGVVEASTLASGSYDHVKLRFSLSRKPKFFLEQVLIQDLLFLGVCYSGFFVSPTVAPARALLAAIPVLIMRTLANYVFESLPHLAYQVWLVDYLMVSMWLCVLCVAQFAVTQFFLLSEARGSAYFRKLQATEADMRRLIGVARARADGTMSLLDSLRLADVANGLVANWNYTRDFYAPEGEAAPSVHACLPTRLLADAEEHAAERAADGEGERSAEGSADPLAGDGPLRGTAAAEEERISEANAAVLERASQEFKRFDKDGSGCLAPHEIRRMLLTFNVHTTTPDCAGAMCRFLRDRGKLSPKDPMKASLRLGSFLEFLYVIEEYLIAVPRRMQTPLSQDLPYSRRADIAAQWLFPVIVLLKMALFFAILPAYHAE